MALLWLVCCRSTCACAHTSATLGLSLKGAKAMATPLNSLGKE